MDEGYADSNAVVVGDDVFDNTSTFLWGEMIDFAVDTGAVVKGIAAMGAAVVSGGYTLLSPSILLCSIVGWGCPSASMLADGDRERFPPFPL